MKWHNNEAKDQILWNSLLGFHWFNNYRWQTVGENRFLGPTFRLQLHLESFQIAGIIVKDFFGGVFQSI